MRLRTSFCNGAVLEKNIRRYCPLWLGYCAFLAVYLLAKGNSIRSEMELILRQNTTRLGTLVYGAIAAITLFGDLFSRRRSLWLHAMPVKRGGWFLTNVNTGLLFFLIPLLLYFTAFGRRNVDENLFLIRDFLFSFGTALLCVQLSGSRVGAALLMIMALCMPAVCKWLYAELYYRFCPGIGLEEITETGILESIVGSLKTSRETATLRGILGIVFGGLAYVLYRFRKIENTESFGILPGLKYVFAAVFSLVLSTITATVFSGDTGRICLVLYLSLPVFFACGAMLAQRQVRIWKRGYIVTFCILLLSLFGSLGFIRADLAGWLRYVPEPQEVQSVKVMINDYGKNNGYRYFEYTAAVLTAPEDIESITRIHRQLLPYRSTYEDGQMVYLTYTMDDGNQILRYYPIALTESFEALEKTLSTQRVIFGTTDFESYVNQVHLVQVCGSFSKKGSGEFVFGSGEENGLMVGYYSRKCQKRELLEQLLWLLQDACEAEELGQLTDDQYRITIYSVDETGAQVIRKLTVPASARDVDSFLQEYWQKAGALDFVIEEDFRLP